MHYHEAQKIMMDIENEMSNIGLVGTAGDYNHIADQTPGGHEAMAITLATVTVAISAFTRVINCTPHPIRFETHGELVEVEPSGITLPARTEERIVAERNRVQFVETTFGKDDDAAKDVEALVLRWGGDVLLIGSLISAQAYAPHVVSMIPVPGFERVPPEQKRMRADKFNIYSR